MSNKRFGKVTSTDLYACRMVPDPDGGLDVLGTSFRMGWYIRPTAPFKIAKMINECIDTAIICHRENGVLPREVRANNLEGLYDVYSGAFL
ncbi:MAG: hypothetical protein AABX23_01205 [Nanoarchaeota archaeon]